MGRNRHPLIQKHFKRGNKIPGASNRYEQSCMHCKDDFPKGRTDALLKHLVKDCLNISDLDRAEAANGVARVVEEDVSLQAALEQDLNSVSNDERLKILANTALDRREASSVDDLSTPSKRLKTQQPLARLNLAESFSLDNPPPSLDSPYRAKGSRGQGKTRGRGQARASSLRSGAHASTSPNTTSNPNFPDALNGNGQNYFGISNGQETMIDPSLQNHAFQQLVGPDFHAHPGQNEQSAWVAQDYYPNEEPYEDEPEDFANEIQYDQTQEYSALSEASPPIMFSAETGNGKRSRVPPKRGKFDIKRKEEVRQMRSLGACLRCRVLKKPCTPGDPCKNCQISDPRVWTFKCTRHRLDTGFIHFKCKVYSILAYTNTISSFKETGLAELEEKTIDVTQFPDSSRYLSYSSRRSVFVSTDVEEAPSSVGPSSSTDAGSPGDPLIDKVTLLEYEVHDIPSMLMEHMRQLLPNVIDAESSPFTSTILAEAQKHATTWTHNIQNSPTNVSQLAVETYAMVQILLNKDLSWYITERSKNDAPGSGTPILAGTKSYNIIVQQLQAAAEKSASMLVENLLSSLDRMVLKSDSKQRFDLFIVGLIILDVLEKATWEFCKWQRIYQADPQQWPLSDKTPMDFVEKRRSIPELLSNLLRVRDIPAATKADKLGILSTERAGEFQNFYKKAALSEQAVKDAFALDPTVSFDLDNPSCFHLSLSAWLLLPVEQLPKS